MDSNHDISRDLAVKVGLVSEFEERLKSAPDHPIYALRLAASNSLRARAEQREPNK